MDDLLTMTITVPASKEVLEERLASRVAERERRRRGRVFQTIKVENGSLKSKALQ